MCGRAAAWDKPRSGQNAGLAHDVGQWRKSDAGGREVLSADFADAADEEKEICAICVICGSPIPHSAIRIPHLNGSFPVFILEWTNVGKAVEGHRSPKPGGNEERPAEREASWSAPALWRFGTGQLPSECRRGNGARGTRTRLGDDGNQMGALSALLAASKQLAAS